MRIAKDGKPFDIDGLGELGKDEIEVIQFLRPDGKRRRMAASIGEKYVKMAKNLIISAEQLVNCDGYDDGEIVVYVRKKVGLREKEISEIAINGPGETSPTECLKRLILRCANKED